MGLTLVPLVADLNKTKQFEKTTTKKQQELWQKGSDLIVLSKSFLTF